MIITNNGRDLEPGLLTSQPEGYRSQDSLVSTCSQLTCDSDYSLGREEVMLPCSRDPYQ